MKKAKKAFTLVELLVVIAIIAILAAIIAPNAFKAIEKSKVATAESDYRAIKTAALSYYSDMGVWPDKDVKGKDEENLFIKGSGLEPNWNGPYLEKWPNKNPWGGTYEYIKLNSNTIPGGEANKAYYCIKLEQVPTKAIERLEADLDGNDGTDKGKTGIVRYDDKKVYIIISEQ